MPDLIAKGGLNAGFILLVFFFVSCHSARIEEFRSDKYTIAQDSAARLSWWSDGVEDEKDLQLVLLPDTVVVPPAGIEIVTPAETTQYRLVLYNGFKTPDQQVRDSKIVTLNVVPPPDPVIVFSIDKSIAKAGEALTISWNIEHGEGYRVAIAGIGEDLALRGKESITAIVDEEYVLTLTKGQKRFSRSVSYRVEVPEPVKVILEDGKEMNEIITQDGLPVDLLAQEGVTENNIADGERKIQISQIEPRREDDGRLRIRIKFHVYDERNNFVSGLRKSDLCRPIVDSDLQSRNSITAYTMAEVSELQNTTRAMNVALVMDHSGSMRDACGVMQKAVCNFWENKQTDDSLSFVRYTLDVTPVDAPDGDFDEFRERLGICDGGTATIDGIGAGLQELIKQESSRPQHLIVYTDGAAGENKIFNEAQVVHLARGNGIPIHSIAFGNGSDQQLLRRLARATGGSFHQIGAKSQFADIYRYIYDRLKNYYVLEYTLQTASYGTHEVEICIAKSTESGECRECSGDCKNCLSARNCYVPEFPMVHFDNDHFLLKRDLRGREQSEKALQAVTDFLRDNPEQQVRIRAHTDSDSSNAYNDDLSANRAATIRDTLVARGVKPDQLQSVHFGESLLLLPDYSESGKAIESAQALNRRVEFEAVYTCPQKSPEESMRTIPEVVVHEPPRKGCRAFFTGLVVSDRFHYVGISRAYQPDAFSEYVGQGNYEYNVRAFPKAVFSTFDGIAIDSGTRVIVYSRPNFQGRVLLDKTGPAIINNFIWKNDYRYRHCNSIDYDEELQKVFPQELRVWSSSNMHYWSYGSVKVMCEH